jgi:uncharacterized membrane protein
MVMAEPMPMHMPTTTTKKDTEAKAPPRGPGGVPVDFNDNSEPQYYNQMYNHGYGGGYYEGDYEDYAYPGYHGYEYEYGGPSRGHGGGVVAVVMLLIFVANSKMKQIIAMLMITIHAAGMIVVAATAINTWII